MPTLSDIAEFLGCELRGGNRAEAVEGVNTLAAAGSELWMPVYTKALRSSVKRQHSGVVGRSWSD